MASDTKQHISRLVKEFSGRNTTESLIGFVAETTGMIKASKSFLEDFESGDAGLKKWLEQECSSHGIDSWLFLRELSTIIALFQPEQGGEDHYAVLGIPVDATQEEIKHAYRKLSLKYHPDTAGPGQIGNTEKFIKIHQAYHALIGVKQDVKVTKGSNKENHWRTTKKGTTTVSSKQRKSFSLWILGCIIVLLGFSVFATLSHKKQVMLAGLQEIKGTVQQPAISDNIALQPEHPSIQSASQAEIQREVVLADKAKEQQQVNKDDQDVKTKSETVVTNGIRKNPAVLSETVNNKTAQTSINHEVVVPEAPGGKSVPRSDTVPSQVKEASQLVPEPAKLSDSSQPDSQYKTAEQGATRVAGLEKRAMVKKKVEPRTKEIESLPSIPPTIPINHSKAEKIKRKSESRSKKKIAVIQKKHTSTKESLNKSMDKSALENERNNVSSKKADLQGRVEKFFHDYAESYAKRNIILFSRFYGADAAENDKPFTSLIKVYSDLFEATSSDSLRLNILTWKKVDNGIHAVGRFEVTLKYKDGHQFLGTGPITFVLKDDGDMLRVRLITYRFDTQ